MGAAAGVTTTVHSDAGMLAVWDAAAFTGIDGYDDWERRVEDRLAEAIRSGELVPVNIGYDGAYGVRLVVGADDLTDRESRFAVVTSATYLLTVTGDAAQGGWWRRSRPRAGVCLSGIEFVGHLENAPITVDLAPGRYAVRTTLIEWDEDPDSKAPDGTPTADALPDFVVRITPVDGTEEFRTEELTFDPLE